MNDQNPTAAQPNPEAEAEVLRNFLRRLHKQYHFLETLFALAISALILLSLGLNLFLFKQTRSVRSQLVAQRQISTALLDEFHNKRESAIHNFILKLDAYSNTNPDFRPVLEKYRPYLGKYFPSASSNQN